MGRSRRRSADVVRSRRDSQVGGDIMRSGPSWKILHRAVQLISEQMDVIKTQERIIKDQRNKLDKYERDEGGKVRISKL